MKPHEPYNSRAKIGIDLPSNEVAVHFQSLFLSIFGDSPVGDTTNKKMGNKSGTIISPSSEPEHSSPFTKGEQQFFHHLYVPRSPLRVDKTNITEQFECLRSVPFGENENDIAEFIFHPEAQVLLLVGRVGYGKTTLISSTLSDQNTCVGSCG